MASQFFTRIGQLGVGVAVVGSVVNSALYNGKFLWLFLSFYINILLKHIACISRYGLAAVTSIGSCIVKVCSVLSCAKNFKYHNSFVGF